ncbi:MAG TPA: VWA domain-containing protein [Ignavibacteriaceae bacterium]|nr:VWA domain-containing protein [Ignavibacteriaceae bacterium]
MLRLAHPEYLYALYLVPLLAVLYWYLARKRKRMLAKFAEEKLHPVLLPAYSKMKSLIKFSLISLAIVFLIIAAADPQIGTKVENVKESGIDVYIMLDVSLSMQAQDIKPSRLEKAKFEIANLMQKLHGDRIGLIIFAGQAYVQFPLTSDYSAAKLFLDAVDENSVPQPGTAIAAAINLATKSFDYSSKTEKVEILITDGEDHQGDVTEAATDAAKKGIMIYTIGLGSPDGVPIPIFNQQGQQTGFKTDENGNTVITKLHEGTLKKIAEIAHGKYFRGANYQDELDLIYKDLSSLRKTQFGEKRVTDYEDRFYYFLAIAIILLVAEYFMSEKKSPWVTKLNKRFGIE